MVDQVVRGVQVAHEPVGPPLRVGVSQVVREHVQAGEQTSTDGCGQPAKPPSTVRVGRPVHGAHQHPTSDPADRQPHPAPSRDPDVPHVVLPAVVVAVDLLTHFQSSRKQLVALPVEGPVVHAPQAAEQVQAEAEGAPVPGCIDASQFQGEHLVDGGQGQRHHQNADDVFGEGALVARSFCVGRSHGVAPTGCALNGGYRVDPLYGQSMLSSSVNILKFFNQPMCTFIM